MRHQRQGLRRLVALPVALLAALVIAPSISAASPNTSGGMVLEFNGCQAHMTAIWTAQPGKLKAYSVEISSDLTTPQVAKGTTDFSRSGFFDITFDFTALGSINTFRAVTRVYDGKGVEQANWPSGDVAASCS